MILQRLNLYLKLSLLLGKPEFDLFKCLCTVLNDATELEYNQIFSEGLKELTRIMFTIAIILQSKGKH